MRHIFRCVVCGCFTMRESCACGGKAISIKPQRYSPGRFAEYRQFGRKDLLVKEGLL